MHLGLTVAEPAIAAAYVLLGKADPLAAAADLVRGYHAACPLHETEIALLHTLIAARLAVSVTNAALMKIGRPDDPYVTISEAPAWDALERWLAIHPRLAHYRFREACGLPALPHGPRVAAWIGAQDAAPVLAGIDLRSAPSLVLDLGVSSRLLGADPAAAETGALTRTIFSAMERASVGVAVGRYDEPRLLYSSDLFGSGPAIEERRTVHLGVDLFVAPGTPVHAPLDAVVHLRAHNRAPLDYGPLVILRHSTGDEAFFTLYGHLSADSLEGLEVGQRVRRGEPFARVGTRDENGGWPPHVHVQVILDLLGRDADFPGVAPASERALWTSLSPDPNLLLRIPKDRFPTPRGVPGGDAGRAPRAHRRKRAALLPPAGQGRARVHAAPVRRDRPRLPRRLQQRAAGRPQPPARRARRPGADRPAQYEHALPHDRIVEYAARLTRFLPEPLRVCYFVNSGSEANELALRLARTATSREDVVVLEHSYHGHTSTLVDVSPYKFAGPGGGGRKPWVHVAPLPDGYRGPHRRSDPEAGRRYADEVGGYRRSSERGRPRPRRLPGRVDAQHGRPDRVPPGYSAEAYRHVRAAEACASPTRSRRASAGWARTSGGSRRRAWCRTSSCSASRSATGSLWGP
jgi:hypothetical protein